MMHHDKAAAPAIPDTDAPFRPQTQPTTQSGKAGVRCTNLKPPGTKPSRAPDIDSQQPTQRAYSADAHR
jgi:hypothetical protein